MPDVCDGIPDSRRNKASAPADNILRPNPRLRPEVGGGRENDKNRRETQIT